MTCRIICNYFAQNLKILCILWTRIYKATTGHLTGKQNTIQPQQHPKTTKTLIDGIKSVPSAKGINFLYLDILNTTTSCPFKRKTSSTK